MKHVVLTGEVGGFVSVPPIEMGLHQQVPDAARSARTRKKLPRGVVVVWWSWPTKSEEDGRRKHWPPCVSEGKGAKRDPPDAGAC